MLRSYKDLIWSSCTEKSVKHPSKNLMQDSLGFASFRNVMHQSLLHKAEI